MSVDQETANAPVDLTSESDAIVMELFFVVLFFHSDGVCVKLYSHTHSDRANFSSSSL